MANCKKCGAELLNGAEFCMECGQAVATEIKCGGCGKNIPVKAKFCPHCGAEIGKAGDGCT